MPEEPQGKDAAVVIELLDAVVEGLWLRLRDVILVERRLERFVF